MQAPGGMLAGEKLLDQHGVAGQLLCGVAKSHDEKFVTQCQQARWLESDDCRAACDMRCQCRHHAPRLAFGFVDQPCGQVGSAAA